MGEAILRLWRGQGKWGVLAGALLLCLHPVPAVGQAQGQLACYDRQGVMSMLAERYGERPAGIGLANNGAAVELLVSPDGGTWTLLATFPDGLTCPLADGTGWEKPRPAVPGREG